MRARDEDGKWRYLLQQRDDGTWGMPGGTTHVGEDWMGRRGPGESRGDRRPAPLVDCAQTCAHVDP